MREKISQMKPSRDNLYAYLMLFAALFRLLPYLVEVVWVSSTKRGIGLVADQLIREAGVLIFPIAALVLWKVLEHNSRLQAISCALLMGMAVVIEDIGLDILPIVLLARLAEKQWLYYLIFGGILLLSNGIFVAAIPKRKNKFLRFIVGICLMLARELVLVGAGLLGGWLTKFILPSFGENIAIRVLLAAIDTLFVGRVILALTPVAGKTEKAVEGVAVAEGETVAESEAVPEGEEEPETEMASEGGKASVAEATEEVEITVNIARAENKLSSLVRIVLACVAVIGAFIAWNLTTKADPAEQIEKAIDTDMVLASRELLEGNIGTAVDYYHMANARREGFRAVLEVSEDGNPGNLNSYPILEIRMLNWQKNQNLDAYEEYVMENQAEVGALIDLLGLYNQREDAELNEKSNAIRDDIIATMIATDSFCDETLSYEDIQGQSMAIEKALAKYNKLQDYCEMVEILEDTLVAGGAQGEQAMRVLELAKEYPDDINFQYLAVVYGSAYKKDNASHYEDTLEAGKRFVEILEKQEDLSDDQKFNCRCQLVKWSINLGLYDEAMQYISSALELREDEELLGLLAYCQYENSKYDACKETIARLQSVNADNIIAMYYTVMLEIQDKDIDAMIEDTAKMFDLVVAMPKEQKNDAQVLLYEIMQQESYNEVVKRAFIYNWLSDEQKEKIQSHPMYYNYMEAMHKCFGETSDEAHRQALQHIDNIIALDPDLGQVYYLQGSTYYELKEMDNAIASFKKALTYDNEAATTWYALANAYDACGMYEEALDASVMVDNLLPETDHDFDEYGIAIHNGRLQSGILRMLGGN